MMVLEMKFGWEVPTFAVILGRTPPPGPEKNPEDVLDRKKSQRFDLSVFEMAVLSEDHHTVDI